MPLVARVRVGVKVFEPMTTVESLVEVPGPDRPWNLILRLRVVESMTMMSHWPTQILIVEVAWFKGSRAITQR